VICPGLLAEPPVLNGIGFWWPSEHGVLGRVIGKKGEAGGRGGGEITVVERRSPYSLQFSSPDR